MLSTTGSSHEPRISPFETQKRIHDLSAVIRIGAAINVLFDVMIESHNGRRGAVGPEGEIHEPPALENAAQVTSRAIDEAPGAVPLSVCDISA